MIFLNKTGALGKNGDTRMFLSVVPSAASNTANLRNAFDNWVYPNATSNKIMSATGVATQPEIIEICPYTYINLCQGSCVLVIGVQGVTSNLASNFRLTAYSSTNKVYANTPI